MPTTEQTLKPTPASAWKKKQDSAVGGFAVELPSGNVVLMRRTMNILTMLQSGQIPNPLRGIVSGMISNGGDAIAVQDFAEEKTLVAFIDFLDGIIIDALIEPVVERPAPAGKLQDADGKFVNKNENREEYLERIENWVPDNTEAISVFDMEFEDKMFLFTVAQGGTADATQFRLFSGELMEPMEDEPEPPKPTKRTGGASGKRKSKS